MVCTDGFAQEISNLHVAGGTHLNCTHLVSADGSKQLLEKAQIYEAEVTYDSSTAAACPLLAQWAADSSLRTMLSVLWPSASLVLVSQATKLQYNAGELGLFPTSDICSPCNALYVKVNCNCYKDKNRHWRV
jgi:hypothetical protein